MISDKVRFLDVATYTLIFQKGQVLTGKSRISNTLNDYTTPLNVTQLKQNV